MSRASILHVFPAVLLVLAGATDAPAKPLSVDGAATAYVMRDGYASIDPAELDQALMTLLGESGGRVEPGADLSAIEQALLLVDLEEQPLQRARYVLRYGQQTIDRVEVSFIDLQRYNLGPAIRLDAIDSYEAENVADAEAFGVGPHVAWRFVTQPTAKLSAMLLTASRREIADEEAAGRNCLPCACLSLDPIDDLADWSDPQTAAALPPTPYPSVVSTVHDDTVTDEIAPAAQALELAIAAGIAAQGADGLLWSFPERAGHSSPDPFVVVVIDRNLGQETMSDAVIGIAKVDKDHDQRWVRLSGGVFDGRVVQTISEAAGPLVKR
ncbi:hypothetical protein [Jiella pacifica]|uniref:Uncharacterized protein n=1 Tax=Jiella pacifica TaxID=2696469 RepID=A0A6N9T7I4_9HYPH|nr:hypothetical protein [Jiella pacifica]NDW05709.1 hypothetical protein [Jiella pacifica]